VTTGRGPGPSPERRSTVAAERQRSLDRITSFGDAVVTIAATLLVLPLVDTATDIGRKSVSDLLSQDHGQIVAFVLSFTVIFRFWLAHHHTYEYVIDYSQTLIWVNFLWLLSIVFLPFPTQLIGLGGKKGPAAYGLYIGTMLITSATAALEQWIIIRSPNLQSASTLEPRYLRPYVLTTVAMAIALVVATTLPRIGLWSLLLLVQPGMVEDRLNRRAKKATSAA
jgi:uncharacterized membrane protein